MPVGVGRWQLTGPPEVTHELSIVFRVIVIEGPTYPETHVHIYVVADMDAVGLIALGNVGSCGRYKPSISERDKAVSNTKTSEIQPAKSGSPDSRDLRARVETRSP